MGADLQRNTPEPQLAQPIALGQKAFLVDDSERTVPLELRDDPIAEGRLNGRIRRVGRHDITAALQLDGPIERADLVLATEAIRAQAPLQLNRVDAMLLKDVLGQLQAACPRR